ncbi:MAG: hypothetical protein V1874_16265 [Spirochaetota bacterium]
MSTKQGMFPIEEPAFPLRESKSSIKQGMLPLRESNFPVKQENSSLG